MCEPVKEKTLVLSTLPKTWILDLDGTIVKHNGFKLDGHDTFLPGAKEFLRALPSYDMVVFLTSREPCFALQTEKFLEENGVRYNHIIYGAPYGERILVNDDKPSGLKMAYAMSVKRDEPVFSCVDVDEAL